MSPSTDASTSRTSPKLVLVLGGARSGKSAFAERLAASSGCRVAFIATATASDEDMRQRIARHRVSRPQDWYTLEEPLDLAAAIRHASTLADVLLLDCMTLWLANWLDQQDDINLEQVSSLSNAYTNGMLKDIEELLAVVADLAPNKTLIVVSNE